MSFIYTLDCFREGRLPGNVYRENIYPNRCLQFFYLCMLELLCAETVTQCSGCLLPRSVPLTRAQFMSEWLSETSVSAYIVASKKQPSAVACRQQSHCIGFSCVLIASII